MIDEIKQSELKDSELEDPKSKYYYLFDSLYAAVVYSPLVDITIAEDCLHRTSYLYNNAETKDPFLKDLLDMQIRYLKSYYQEKVQKNEKDTFINKLKSIFIFYN